MNALEQYLKKIDNSSYDCKDAHTINSEFQSVCKQLNEEGNYDIAAIADIDRQVFSVQKSFDKTLDNEKGIINGLSWQMSGTQTLEDGSQIPLYWPDVEKFTQQDFEYFEKRFNECKNLYAKTEYGLMVYFGENSECFCIDTKPGRESASGYGYGNILNCLRSTSGMAWVKPIGLSSRNSFASELIRPRIESEISSFSSTNRSNILIRLSLFRYTLSLWYNLPFTVIVSVLILFFSKHKMSFNLSISFLA